MTNISMILKLMTDDNSVNYVADENERMAIISKCAFMNEYETDADEHDCGDDVVDDEKDDNNIYDPNNDEADKGMTNKETNKAKKWNINVCRWVQLID